EREGIVALDGFGGSLIAFGGGVRLALGGAPVGVVVGALACFDGVANLIFGHAQSALRIAHDALAHVSETLGPVRGRVQQVFADVAARCWREKDTDDRANAQTKDETGQRAVPRVIAHVAPLRALLSGRLLRGEN